jgi:methylglyoxal synthase
MENKKTIALIAHDGKKDEMIEFVKTNHDKLNGFNLIATGTTGQRIIETGLQVDCKLSGPKGGDAQIAAMAAEGLLNAVLFFRDPLGKHPHEPDIQMLMRICDVHDVPLATNPSTAKLILLGSQVEI